MSDKVVLAPFHASHSSRLAHISRSNTLLSVLNDPPKATVLTLPNLDGVETRPTSTFVIRPLSDKERSALVNQCGCQVNEDVRIMYRVAGNGEGSNMLSWDVSSSLRDQVRNCTFGNRVIIGVLLDGPDANTINLRVGITNNGFINIFINHSTITANSTTQLLTIVVMMSNNRTKDPPGKFRRVAP